MTAVEYLINNSHIVPKYDLNKKELIKQAKEIEKQQIIDAITQYEIKHQKIFSEQAIINVVNKAEQYYNETYKNENYDKSR